MIPVDKQPTRYEQFKHEFKTNTWPKIKEVALTIFKVLAAGALFVMNPTVFAVGFIVGVVWNEKVDETIDKIVKIVKSQPVPLLLGLCAASILCLQVTSGVASFMYGAYLGSRLVKASDEMSQRNSVSVSG